MSGMDVLFKSMGLDPEAMQRSAAEFKSSVEGMHADLQAIKAQNVQILDLLKRSMISTTNFDLQEQANATIDFIEQRQKTVTNG